MENFCFSKTSLERLKTAHRQLQFLAEEALKISPVDFAIIWGHRGPMAQNEAFAKGKSRVPWPRSPHNVIPSEAIDICPWINGDLNWKNHKNFCVIAGILLGLASVHGYKIRWGGAWDGTMNAPYKLNDLGHFERIIEI